MVANRYTVRAALCFDHKMALLGEHNDANVLVLGSRLISFKKLLINDIFFSTNFSGRHQGRLDKFYCKTIAYYLGVDMTEQVFFQSSLTQTDPAILEAVKNEYHRQNDQIELIASENIVSKAVLEAQGTILTTTAEGIQKILGGCIM